MTLEDAKKVADAIGEIGDYMEANTAIYHLNRLFPDFVFMRNPRANEENEPDILVENV